MKRSLLLILILIIVSLPSISPLFNKGFFESDDGEWMIIRFSAFHESLRDGQFPVRFLGRLNHGYGYPVANFLYPGFMYLAEPIHLLGFGFVDTIKIIFGASMIGSAIFCFFWLSKFFDKLSSLIGSLFYLYAPYHLYDLYKRGSVGEVLALAVVPFILWQIERRSVFWTSIGIAFLIISHNTLAVLFLGLILLYIGLDLYVSKNKKELFKKYFLMAMLSLGLSAFFWIPAFFELQYTVFSQTQISNVNSYFSNVDLIGFSTIFVLFLTAVFMSTSIIPASLFELRGASKVQKHRLTLLLFIIGLVSVLFSSSMSTPLWNILPVSFIQFPFRFLSLTIVSISFLTACVISVLPRKLKIPVTVLSLIILVLSAKPFLMPSEFFDKGEGFYTTNMDTTTVKNEYMPKWVKKKPVERFVEKVEIVDGVGSIKNVVYNSKKITFDVTAEDNTMVKINTVYYPGWEVKVDGKEFPISYTNDQGVMDIGAPSGRHMVKVRFAETPFRLISDLTSLISLLILILIIKNKHIQKRLFI